MKRIKQERWINVPDGEEENNELEVPYFKKDLPQQTKPNNKMDNEYFTGEKNKKLLIHIVQNGIEVSKPVRKRIYDQQLIWKKRIFPIDIKRAIVDSKGQHHLFVNANDMSILSFSKDHEDNCRKCGGKMFIDAKNARDLVKRNTIQAIWGIDSTHMILLMVFAVGMMAAVGFAFYSYNQDTLHNTQLTAEKAKNVQLAFDYELLKNQTRQVIVPPPVSNPNSPDIVEPPDVSRVRPDNQGGDAEIPTNGEVLKLPDIIIPSNIAQGNGYIIK